ncbi:hypothetical protein SOV_48290 [Sporomusa ovata DSM 2662]|nr:hypothetical protein SOV_2c00980 [Sporomusa ovata DSM 2662]
MRASVSSNEFRLGVADDESDGSARYSGKSWLKSNMGGNAGECSRPCRGMGVFLYIVNVVSSVVDGLKLGGTVGFYPAPIPYTIGAGFLLYYYYYEVIL